jgi:hypothetical protein
VTEGNANAHCTLVLRDISAGVSSPEDVVFYDTGGYGYRFVTDRAYLLKLFKAEYRSLEDSLMECMFKYEDSNLYLITLNAQGKRYKIDFKLYYEGVSQVEL